MTLAQAAMELRLTARRPENVLVTLVVPPVLLVFFSAIEVLPTGTARPVDFLLPGALALAVIATGFVNLGIATAYERAHGVLKRLGGTPLPRGGLLAAKMAAVGVVEAAGAVILLAVASGPLGWAPGPMADPAVTAIALVLGTVAFASLGLAMAGALRAEATLALANGVFLLFLVLGGIVLPIDHLPVPLEGLAGLLPAAALSEALRIGLGAATGSAVGPLALLAAWGAGASLVAARTFRWE
jgi:ABC-2 type transport system permease protein